MRHIDWTPDYPDMTGWKTRHRHAVRDALNGTSAEDTHQASIVHAIDAWINYAVAHKMRFESPIGEDYVLGPAWARWGFALRDLLNGETGRLDCGTLDTIICYNLTEMGFKPEDGAP